MLAMNFGLLVTLFLHLATQASVSRTSPHHVPLNPRVSTVQSLHRRAKRSEAEPVLCNDLSDGVVEWPGFQQPSHCNCENVSPIASPSESKCPTCQRILPERQENESFTTGRIRIHHEITPEAHPIQRPRPEFFEVPIAQFEGRGHRDSLNAGTLDDSGDDFTFIPNPR